MKTPRSFSYVCNILGITTLVNLVGRVVAPPPKSTTTVAPIVVTTTTTTTTTTNIPSTTTAQPATTQPITTTAQPTTVQPTTTAQPTTAQSTTAAPPPRKKTHSYTKSKSFSDSSFSKTKTRSRREENSHSIAETASNESTTFTHSNFETDSLSENSATETASSKSATFTISHSSESLSDSFSETHSYRKKNNDSLTVTASNETTISGISNSSSASFNNTLSRSLSITQNVSMSFNELMTATLIATFSKSAMPRFLQAFQNPWATVFSRGTPVATTKNALSGLSSMVGVPANANAGNKVFWGVGCDPGELDSGSYQPAIALAGISANNATMDDAMASTTVFMGAIVLLFLGTRFLNIQCKLPKLGEVNAHKIAATMLASTLFYHGPNVTWAAVASLLTDSSAGSGALAIGAMAAWSAAFVSIGYGVLIKSDRVCLRPFCESVKEDRLSSIALLVDLFAAHVFAALSGAKAYAKSCEPIAFLTFFAAAGYCAYLGMVRPYRSRLDQWVTTGGVATQLVLSVLNLSAVFNPDNTRLASVVSGVESFAFVYALFQIVFSLVYPLVEWCRKKENKPSLPQISNEEGELQLSGHYSDVRSASMSRSSSPVGVEIEYPSIASASSDSLEDPFDTRANSPMPYDANNELLTAYDENSFLPGGSKRRCTCEY